MKTILFVCVHNSGRSQMAEAIFNSLARGKSRAISAGTIPATDVNPVVVKAMSQIGIDISNNKPKPLTVEKLEKADRIISMGCLDSAACPARLAFTEDWGLPDPAGKSLEEVVKIRDKIRECVSKLLKEIETPLMEQC